MGHIGTPACKVIVDAQYIMSLREQTLAEKAANEAGTACDHDALTKQVFHYASACRSASPSAAAAGRGRAEQGGLGGAPACGPEGVGASPGRGSADTRDGLVGSPRPSPAATTCQTPRTYPHGTPLA